MVKMHFIFHHREKDWETSNQTFLRGHILLGDEELSSEKLDSTLSDKRTIEEVSTVLRDVNGHYAIVHAKEEEAYMVVDRVRSIPLFYGHDHHEVYVSDDPFWIQKQMQNREIDKLATREFLLSGYVTDDRTLSPVIKQVRSGEIVHLFLDQGQIKVECLYYQRYVPKDYLDNDVEARLKELDPILVKVFERLIKQAKGRTMVVPLSGGYDSRLIVLMLKRLGYANVITFTYGRHQSGESEISRSIAQRLGFRWEFVEYTNEKWLDWFHSDQYRDYSRMGSGLSSSPIIQDFPAVMVMKDNHAVPADSMFVPGHTVTLAASGILEGDMQQIGTAIDDIIKHHYNLTGRPIKDSALLRETKDNISRSLGERSKYPDRISAYESWDINERQSKFIVNAVRIYEYWGYSWALPLLDKELMDFWSKVPLDLRMGKKLMKIYIDGLSKEMLKDVEIFHVVRKSNSKGWRKLIEPIVKQRTISRLIQYPFYHHRKVNLYQNHPQAYYGMIPWDQYRMEFTGRESIVYFTAKDFIDRLEATLGDRRKNVK